MARLFHLHSRYARLNDELIDVTLEHVRDADEVLFGCDALDARDMIRIASAVMSTERLFEQESALLIGLTSAARSDWTLACIAEALAQASKTLEQRGSKAGAERARADQRTALRRIVDSPVRSPLVGYDAVLSALRLDLPPAHPAEMLELQHLALAEAIESDFSDLALSLLCDVADSRLRLGQPQLALLTFLAVVRFDPTNILTHNHLAVSLSGRFPAMAHAAATRALLLMPREDKHSLRVQLRRIIEETRGPQSEAPTGAARALHEELKASPGKRSRASLRTLCIQAAPEVDGLPQKQPEALPDSAALAQLRRDLHTLPRQLPAVREQRVPRGLLGVAVTPPMAAVSVRPEKVGRNDPCPCGSDRKWKRCCGAR